MTKLYESDLENFTLELLQKQGCAYLSPEDQEVERQSLSDAVLSGWLITAEINPITRF